ncbi:XRE family transcriptional regulator [Actinosynnema pretiosum subsp. pretiosum]
MRYRAHIPHSGDEAGRLLSAFQVFGNSCDCRRERTVEERQTTHNQVSGRGNNIVQAGVVHGDVVVGSAPVPQVPRELPAGARHFVEREAELAALERALEPRTDGQPSLVVISGTAGVGKTALALRWAHQHVDDFPDGQLFVDLHGFAPEPPVSSLEAASRLLRSLGVSRPEELIGIGERSAKLRTVMSGRRMILLLDNAKSTHQVLPLLPGASSSVVLVTSRHVLSGLGVYRDAPLLRVDPLDVRAGTRLLVALAGRAVLEVATAAMLTGVCAGLPLALRIVAQRLASSPGITATVLADELRGQSNRLSSMTAEADIRSVFSWSYRDLGEVTAAVFRAVGVQPRGAFDLDALAAASGYECAVVATAVDELVKVHLLSEVAPGLFSAHDLLRSYAVELTVAREGERSAALRRIFEHYLHNAAHADLLLTPHRTRIPLVGQPGVLKSFSGAQEAQAWLRGAEAAMVDLSRVDEPELDAQRWQLAYVLRTYFYLNKQLDGWLESHFNALSAAVRSQDAWAEATTRNNLGMALTGAGRLGEAMEHYAKAVELFDRLGDGHGRSNALANSAAVLRRRGEPAAALELQERALDHYRRTGALSNVGITLRGMAGSHLQLGDSRSAVSCAQEAVDVAMWFSYDLDIAQASTMLAAALRIAGNLVHAEVALWQAVAAAVRCGSRFEHARALQVLGEMRVEKGDHCEAREYWEKALIFYRELGSGHADILAEELCALPAPEGPGR